MILVDTSVLISYLKNQKNKPNEQFDYILDRQIPYGINVFIYQEVLQGARNSAEYDLLKEYFETIPFYHLKYGKNSYEQAALINIKCREKGITVRSTIDLLIVQTAIENNLYLLHNNKDFTSMSKTVKELKVYN